MKMTISRKKNVKFDQVTRKKKGVGEVNPRSDPEDTDHRPEIDLDDIEVHDAIANGDVVDPVIDQEIVEDVLAVVLENVIEVVVGRETVPHDARNPNTKTIQNPVKSTTKKSRI